MMNFPQLRRALQAVLLISFIPVLSGCVSAAIGAGATVGVAVMGERSLKTAATDTTAATKIHFNLADKHEMLATKVGVEVYEGEALLTGAVDTEIERANAMAVAWQVEGITNVYNEIQVTDNGLLSRTKDAYVTSTLTAKMTLDEDIYAINYSIETVNGIVYLIGLARSQGELDKTIAHARTISYVKNIIPHVRIKKATS